LLSISYTIGTYVVTLHDPAPLQWQHVFLPVMLHYLLPSNPKINIKFSCHICLTAFRKNVYHQDRNFTSCFTV